MSLKPKLSGPFKNLHLENQNEQLIPVVNFPCRLFLIVFSKIKEMVSDSSYNYSYLGLSNPYSKDQDLDAGKL